MFKEAKVIIKNESIKNGKKVNLINILETAEQLYII